MGSSQTGSQLWKIEMMWWILILLGRLVERIQNAVYGTTN
jgi:hypothetical protein